MDPKQLFWEAVENHSPDDWDGFLESACPADPIMRCQVAELLAAHLQQNPLLDGGPLCEIQPSTSMLERPGMCIGPYKLLEEIGEGGFGVIFMAEQTQPIRRRVAVKVLKPGVDTRQVIARFEAERQALALMQHPHIACILDSGVAPSGRPFFTMELVKGIPITAYVEQVRLPVADRLRLFIEVCSAVQHAHTKGVIHRDLKPSNVMVTQCDGRAFVKVIDFGIAKALGHLQLTDKTLFTEYSHFIGTPAYMSPEQAAMSAVDVDTRSDVYSLGVLLYELLTTTTPVSDGALRNAGYDEMRRLICEYDPLRPSARLTTLRQNHLTAASEEDGLADPFRGLQVKRELDWIVTKALEKDRARRYQSALALAADVEAHLQGEAVTASPPSAIYRLSKAARRHRIALTMIGVVFASLMFATISSLWQVRRADSARQATDRSLVRERAAHELLAEREVVLRRQVYSSDMEDAWQSWHSGDLDRARGILARYEPAPGGEDLREFSWRFLDARCQYRPRSMSGHDAPILSAALSPNEKLLASCDRGGVIKLWDLANAREIASWRYSEKEVTSVAFSPDGNTLATAGQDATIRLWSVSDQREIGCLRGHTATVMSVSWSPNGERLVSGARDNSIRIWHTETLALEKGIEGLADVVRCVLWLPDGQRVVAAVGPSVQAWDAHNGSHLGELCAHAQGVLALAASPDGALLATGGYGQEVIVCDLSGCQKTLFQEFAITARDLRPPMTSPLSDSQGELSWRTLGCRRSFSSWLDRCCLRKRRSGRKAADRRPVIIPC